jgi:hypothetical protein
LLLVLGTASVQAHAIRAVVSITDTQIVVTVSFDGDDDLRGDVFVRLEDEQRHQIGKLKLSGNNLATFPRPENEGVYFVVAEDDGFGHRAEKRINIRSNRTLEEEPSSQTSKYINMGAGLLIILFLSMLFYKWRGSTHRIQHGS